MPQRFLRPQIRQSKRWNRLGYFEQSLYIRLITLVDDFARYEADPELIRSEAFPYGDPDGNVIPLTSVDIALTTLAVKDMVLLYEVKGVKYLQLTRWQERTRADKSRFPEPCEQMLSDVDKCSPPKPSSSSSSSSTPTTMLRESTEAHRPDWNEVKFHAVQIGLAEWKARDWFDEMEGCGWLDHNKRPIQRWQSVIARVRTKWEADGRPTGPPTNRNPNGQHRPPESNQIQEVIHVKTLNPKIL